MVGCLTQPYYTYRSLFTIDPIFRVFLTSLLIPTQILHGEISEKRLNIANGNILSTHNNKKNKRILQIVQVQILFVQTNDKIQAEKTNRFAVI